MEEIQVFDRELSPLRGEPMTLATLPETEKLALIRNKIVEMWVNEDYLVMKLMDWAENAFFQGPKWEILPDHKTRLMYLNRLIKLLWLDKKEPLVITFRSLTSPEMLY